MSIISDYDEAMKDQTADWDSPRPTAASLKEIYRRLGFSELPSLFVEFVGQSEKYSIFFASLGDDYDAWNNIVHSNLYWRRFGLPPELILFTLAYDGICVCFDTTSSDEPSRFQVVKTFLYEKDYEGYEVVARDFAHYLTDVIEWCRRQNQ